MLRLAQSNQLLVPPLLLLYAIVLRLLPFWETIETPVATHAPFFNDTLLPFLERYGLSPSLIALALVYAQALILNTLANRYKLLGSTQYTVALLYILVASALPEFLILSPALIANTFLLIALSELFQWYRAHQAAAPLFNVGFWVAVGSLCYFPMASYYLLALIGLASLRNFRPQEWLILTLGLLVPYFWLGTYAYWIGAWPQFLHAHLTESIAWLDWHWHDVRYLYFKLGLPTVLVLWVLATASPHFYKINIQQQKYLNLIFLTLFVGLLGLVYQRGVSVSFFIYLAVPLSVFLALHLRKIRRQWLAELLHFLLWITVIGFQYKDDILHFLVLR